VDEHTVLVFHGGGNLGDLATATFRWELHQTVRERVLAQHRNTRCVILPQTVHFCSLQAQEQSLKLLAQHPRLKVFARDLVSLRKLKDGGLSTAQAMPDMAHSLYGVLRRDPVQASGMMAMIRRDQESSHNEVTTSFAEATDWDEIVPSALRSLGFVTKQLARIDRLLGLPVDHTKLFYPMKDRSVRKAIATFSRYERVVTDRLHGTILSLLLGIPVKAIDNSYGKLSTYCAAWLQGCRGLKCAWSEENNPQDRHKPSV
jgi:pyruvyl transferase EpsO